MVLIPRLPKVPATDRPPPHNHFSRPSHFFGQNNVSSPEMSKKEKGAAFFSHLTKFAAVALPLKHYPKTTDLVVKAAVVSRKEPDSTILASDLNQERPTLTLYPLDLDQNMSNSSISEEARGLLDCGNLVTDFSIPPILGSRSIVPGTEPLGLLMQLDGAFSTFGLVVGLSSGVTPFAVGLLSWVDPVAVGLSGWVDPFDVSLTKGSSVGFDPIVVGPSGLAEMGLKCGNILCCSVEVVVCLTNIPLPKIEHLSVPWKPPDLIMFAYVSNYRLFKQEALPQSVSINEISHLEILDPQVAQLQSLRVLVDSPPPPMVYYWTGPQLNSDAWGLSPFVGGGKSIKGGMGFVYDDHGLSFPFD